MEVMLYFAHGIADAFGAPDVSGCTAIGAGDSGATEILLDAIDGVRMSQSYEGVIRWNTLLSTSTQMFLGCPPLDKLTDATYNDASVDTSPHFMQNLSSSIIAVQHGDLAVVAPWLDISQPLSCHRSFRFTIVQGRLGLPIDDSFHGPVLQELARDIAVIETQHTEDVSDYDNTHKTPVLAPKSAIQILEDESETFCDYMLVSVDQTRYKLLMRVSSNLHSRMVDPSMAMLKLASQVIPVSCKHAKSRDSVVPESSTGELYGFDQLLGRWGDTTKRETISPDNSSEPESVTPKTKKTKETQKPLPLRLSHSLNTHFKYKTALALTNDDSVFVNLGDACLSCSLQQAVASKETGCARWIISKARDPERQVPRPKNRITSAGQKGKLKAKTTEMVESGTRLQEATEVDE